MNRRTKILLIWTVGNLILIGKYFVDKLSIQCEPCLPNYPCPPCQTDYMSNIWLYLLGWNLIAIILGLVWMKLKK
jgi:hypothetical protein